MDKFTYEECGQDRLARYLVQGGTLWLNVCYHLPPSTRSIMGTVTLTFLVPSLAFSSRFWPSLFILLYDSEGSGGCASWDTMPIGADYAPQDCNESLTAVVKCARPCTTTSC